MKPTPNRSWRWPRRASRSRRCSPSSNRSARRGRSSTRPRPSIPARTIGADVWLGPHVTVGAGAQVGARSVLLRRGHDRSKRGARRRLPVPSARVSGRPLHRRRPRRAASRCDHRQRRFRLGVPRRTVREDSADRHRRRSATTSRSGRTRASTAPRPASRRIGTGTKIDNLCQIGHNSRHRQPHRDRRVRRAWPVRPTIGDYVQVGGQTMFKGHITVGDRGDHRRRIACVGRRTGRRLRQRPARAEPPRRGAAPGVPPAAAEIDRSGRRT